MPQLHGLANSLAFLDMHTTQVKNRPCVPCEPHILEGWYESSNGLRSRSWPRVRLPCDLHSHDSCSSSTDSRSIRSRPGVDTSSTTKRPWTCPEYFADQGSFAWLSLQHHTAGPEESGIRRRR